MTIRCIASVSLVLIVVSRSLFGQQLTLRDLRAAYESFEYATVIRLADTLLERKHLLATGDLIEVHLLKAIAHFSLGNEEGARQSIVSVLVLQPDYRPDSSTVSPKIIRMFEKTRMELLRMEERRTQSTLRDPAAVHTTRAAGDDLMRGAIFRSLVLPGWGHAYISDTPKCWILLSASAATMGSMTYFIMTTASREADYLNETRPQFIEEKYDRYNSSYKLRNALVATYVVLWLYAQADLLLFSGSTWMREQIISVVPGFWLNHAPAVALTVSFNLTR